WQSPRPTPDYRHEQLRRFHMDWELGVYQDQMTVRGILEHARLKLGEWLWANWPWPSWRLIDSPILAVPMLAWPWVVRDRWMRLVLILLVTFLAVLLASTWLRPHYAAPATGLVFVLELQAMRQLRLWRWGSWKPGRWALGAILILYFVNVTRDCRGASRYAPK